MKKLVFILTLLIQSSAFAQFHFLRWDTLPVDVGGSLLINPWAGGFNNPQFSTIDVNNDGILDLFVYEKSLNKPIVFINYGTPNTIDYHHAPQYEHLFPKLNNWALLRDYNCDGKMDIYASTNLGIEVYRNDFTDSLHFTKMSTLLLSMGMNIYVSRWDIPAIADVDYDGDMDILTFDIFGNYLNSFLNHSMDNYGICDSLDYIITDSCWGKFNEDFGGCTVTLGITCGTPVSGGGGYHGAAHAGSTTLALDLEGDHDMDLIIGDVTCTKVYQLTNGGDSATANMSVVNTSYPATYPVDIMRFPATFYLDVNNDGKKDLIGAPNGLNISENHYSAWFYNNIGTASVPVFEYQEDNFLQKDMIDVGEGAIPVLFNYNGDSLLDLLVSDYNYFDISGTPVSKVSLFENVGTFSAPSFKFITDDYSSLSTTGMDVAIFPAMGDLDDDGDLDMMVGDASGHLHYFENFGGAGNTASFSLMQPMYPDYLGNVIDVGQYAAPQIVDVNRDNLLDLLIGERDGYINYYKNIGTSSSPLFMLITDTFGQVNVTPPGWATGYSTPLLTVLDSTNSYSLLVGAEDGEIHKYTNIEGNLTGAFLLEDSIFENINEGYGTILTGGDINNDSIVDLLLGNRAGGMAIYKGFGKNTPPTPPEKPFNVQIYPNPASSQLVISIDGLHSEDSWEVKIYNTLGDLVRTEENSGSLGIINLTVNTLSNGIYFCKLHISRIGKDDYNDLVKFAIIKN